MNQVQDAVVEGEDKPQSVQALTVRHIHHTPDFLKDIAEFHEKFELAYNGPPRMLPRDLREFRHRFQLEELDEWYGHAVELNCEAEMPVPDVANITFHLEHQLDAILDQLYVLLGTAYLQGMLPMLEEGWTRVHKANMSKVRKLRASDDAKDSGRAPEYDVVKPADFSPPSHVDLIEEHAHR